MFSIVMIFAVMLSPAVIGAAITLLFRRLKPSYIPIIVALLFLPLMMWDYKGSMFLKENIFKEAGIMPNASLSFGLLLFGYRLENDLPLRPCQMGRNTH